MYLLYSALYTLAWLALLPYFAFAALRHGKYTAGLLERFGALPAFNSKQRPIVWLHCVSVGETQAARPLARRLLDEYASYTLVVSTITLTGQRIAREAFGEEAALVFYFPFDWAWSVRRALNHIKPSTVLIMETELWPRFLRECRVRRIPVALINGRLSERSMRGYKRVRQFIKRAVNDLQIALMQTAEDAARIKALGLSPQRIEVTGNIKFDAQIDSGETALTTELGARFGFSSERPLIVAASTHAAEERIVIEAFKEISRLAADAHKPRLLIAPRHPERFAEVAALLAVSGLTWARRTHKPSALDKTCDAILLDSIGELRAMYPLAEIVFVGGSIARTGGHNVLEPAAAAACIVTGAHTQNFTAIVKAFREHDALIQLPDMTEKDAPRLLAQVFTELFSDDKKRGALGRNARAAFERNQGATKRTVELLAPLFAVPLKTGR